MVVVPEVLCYTEQWHQRSLYYWYLFIYVGWTVFAVEDPIRIRQSMVLILVRHLDVSFPKADVLGYLYFCYRLPLYRLAPLLVWYVLNNFFFYKLKHPLVSCVQIYLIYI